jgi:hypothetical protein
VITEIFEAMHVDADGAGTGNHGKFLVGKFDDGEWARVSAVDDRPLLRGRGWASYHIFVMDLQTGEGAMFRPAGYAKADLNKHKIWVCPLFEHFLEWLYKQDLADLAALPKLVTFKVGEIPFDLYGYRRPGE